MCWCHSTKFSQFCGKSNQKSFDLTIYICIEQFFYQTCFGHCVQTRTLRNRINSICAALSLAVVRNGREIRDSWSCRRFSALLLYTHSQKSYSECPSLACLDAQPRSREGLSKQICSHLLLRPCCGSPLDTEPVLAFPLVFPCILVYAPAAKASLVLLPGKSLTLKDKKNTLLRRTLKKSAVLFWGFGRYNWPRYHKQQEEQNANNSLSCYIKLFHTTEN